MKLFTDWRARYRTARRFSSSLLASCALTLCVFEAAPALDLYAAYQLARENDPSFLAAQAEHEGAIELVAQARAPLRPQVRIDGSVARTLQDFNQVSSAFTTKRYELSLNQAVYRRDLFVALKQAKTSVAKADVDFAISHQDLMLLTAQAYFDVLTARDDVQFQRANKEAIAQQLKQARQRFEVGLIAITGVEEAKARFDTATADEIGAINTLHDALEKLREITGAYHEDLAGLGTELPLVVPDPVDIDAWTEIALKQNLQIASANYEVTNARQEVQRAKAGHYPTVEVVGSNSYETGGSAGFAAGNREIETLSVTLAVSLPLYQGGLTASQTRSARSNQRRALHRLEQSKRGVQSQTRQSFLGVKSGIARVTALKQARVSNQSALDAVEAGFQVGTRTSVDVLDAQRELFRARFAYASSRYAYIVDTLTLKKAAGILSEEDIQAVSGWLR